MDQSPIYSPLEKVESEEMRGKEKDPLTEVPMKRHGLCMEGLTLSPWQNNSFKMDQTHARARNKYNSQKTGGTDPDSFLLAEMHKRPGNGSLKLKAV